MRLLSLGRVPFATELIIIIVRIANLLPVFFFYFFQDEDSIGTKAILSRAAVVVIDVACFWKTWYILALLASAILGLTMTPFYATFYLTVFFLEFSAGKDIIMALGEAGLPLVKTSLMGEFSSIDARDNATSPYLTRSSCCGPPLHGSLLLTRRTRCMCGRHTLLCGCQLCFLPRSRSRGAWRHALPCCFRATSAARVHTVALGFFLIFHFSFFTDLFILFFSTFF